MGKRHTKAKRYNSIYGGKGYCEPKGFLPYMHKLLGRFKQTRTDVALKMLSGYPGERFLDIGCGKAELCLRAANYFNEIWGLDVSNVRLLEGRELITKASLQHKIKLLEHDVDEGLPFEDRFFDAVTCIAVLEHVFNPPLVVQEVCRVLKTGGVFIIEVPNFAFLPYRLQLLVGKLPATGGIDELGVDWDHLHNFTSEIVKRMLSYSGFNIISISCSGIFSQVRRLYPSLLGADIVCLALKKSYKVWGV